MYLVPSLAVSVHSVLSFLFACLFVFAVWCWSWRQRQPLIKSNSHLSEDAARWTDLQLDWNNWWPRATLKWSLHCCYIVVTSSVIWTRRCRTCISFPSLGVTNKKSITELMTTCLSGGVGRRSSSISTSCLGVKRWRTSSCRGDKGARCLSSVEEGRWFDWSRIQHVGILVYPWEV